jgi:hypothetical protein
MNPEYVAPLFEALLKHPVVPDLSDPDRIILQSDIVQAYLPENLGAAEYRNLESVEVSGKSQTYGIPPLVSRISLARAILNKRLMPAPMKSLWGKAADAFDNLAGKIPPTEVVMNKIKKDREFLRMFWDTPSRLSLLAWSEEYFSPFSRMNSAYFMSRPLLIVPGITRDEQEKLLGFELSNSFYRREGAFFKMQISRNSYLEAKDEAEFEFSRRSQKGAK